MHPPGRPGILEDEMETVVVKTLRDEYEANSAFTRGQLLSYVTSTFAQPVTRGWLDGFLNRHGDALKVCTSYPQEDTRFLIPREYLEQHIVNMQTYVTGRTAELVFNLDEVGSSDWEDRKVKKVIVPAAVDSDAVLHPVSRRFRHMTLVVCVSAGGDCLCPMLVLGQAIPEDIWPKGLTPDEDVMIRRRGSFPRAGFHYVVTTRPYVLEFSEEKVRENPGFCEIWQKNYSVEVLQRRRRLHQFGLINSEYLMS
jgi:hypothetical protein